MYLHRIESFSTYLLQFYYLEGSDAQQWANCKTELSKILVNQCSGTKVLKVTILMSNKWFLYSWIISRLATCTIVKKEGELNVVFKMKSVRRIGLKLMIRFMLIFSKIRICTVTLCVQMANRSRMFLTNTEQFLDSWVELGHDTCHRIQGYDVKPCQQDCKQREKSGFAQQCKKDGGLFKCCIR